MRPSKLRPSLQSTRALISFWRRWARNAAALTRLDQAASIGVFGAAHRAAVRLAAKSGVVYKPCGAGGGDIGVAASDSVERLDAFLADIAEADLTPVALSIDPDGVG